MRLSCYRLAVSISALTRRANSTVAPQALTLLNSEFAVQSAKQFATRIEREAGQEPGERVNRVFAVALQRLGVR